MLSTEQTNNNSSNSGSCGLCIMPLIVLVIVVVLLWSCGSSTKETQYHKDYTTGMDKFNNGDYGNMTRGEKKAVNDYWEWRMNPDN